MIAPLTFGLIGAGRIAETYASAFGALARTGEISVAAVADIQPDAARRLSQGLGCGAFESHRDMLNTCPLDAVVVCTPPSTHAEISVDCLRRGIHVLCEKPLTTDLGVARRMASEALQTEAILSVSSKYRYAEDVVRAQQLVASGCIGEVLQVENCFASCMDMSLRWNSDPGISGGGVIIDNGPHSVDLMQLFLGPLVGVSAIVLNSAVVEESARIFVRNRRGAVGSIDLSWHLNKQLQNYLTVYGTDGMLEINWGGARYKHTAESSWTDFGVGYSKDQAFRAQLQNFARSLRAQEELRSTLEDALASMEVIDAAYRAARANCWAALSRNHHEERAG